MTRSSKKELLTLFKDPKQEFQSSREIFKTLSLDESKSLKFDLFSDLEEKSEEEELQDNTFSSSDHEDVNDHIEKVLKIVDLFHVPNITQDQIILRVFPMSLNGAVSHWPRNKPSGSIKTWEALKINFLSKYCPLAQTTRKWRRSITSSKNPNETLYQAWERFKELLMKCPQHYLTEMQEVILFYNGLEVPTRQILDSKAIQAQLNNLGHEIKKVNEKVYDAQVGCEQYFIILDMPKDIKVPLILGRPFLSTAYAKIDMFKKKITLRVEEEKINFKSVKPASSLINRVYMLSLRKQMELDLEATLIGETLVLNRSPDPLYGDYIELYDLNVPLELSRGQVDELMPTIKEVVKDMDPYLDKGIGEVVVGEPFCKVLCVETKSNYGILGED
uniref:Retrotransposon gag domain-containing protein n=1 Tax=Tanacetum cinerariifolium TaxID=118510 RepID=A0A6L2LY18_TANCI|nr:hypothetical protein [Tanacetum cinerariifolium]